MNKNIRITGIAVWIVLCTACTSTTEEPEALSGNEVRFTASIDAESLSPQTKAESTVTDFADGATMGVYAYSASGYAANGINNKFQCADGVFGSTNKLYWPTKGGLSFIAYSPYSGTMPTATDINADITYPINTCDQSEAMTTDLLYSQLSDATPTNQSVALHFEHALAKLNIVLVGVSGTKFAPQPTVLIKGLKNQANIKLSFSGANVDNLKTVANIVPYRAQNAAEGHDAVSMLVIPQEMTITEEMEFVHIENSVSEGQTDKYSFKLNSTSSILKEGKLIFEAGQEYTLTLNIEYKEAEIQNVLIGITPWNTGGAADGSGNAYFPVINN